ncbi:hypothetical protein [Streptomyces sp. NPDC101234]|uniref:hypothetical protein n=1 Tax=Streptomyces sp. NPDC101234 TaxID=3366138 RepID=UPI003824ADE7
MSSPCASSQAGAGWVTVAPLPSARAVGYVSATQFSREYRTTCGLPPVQDAARLRARLTRATPAPTGSQPRRSHSRVPIRQCDDSNTQALRRR